MAFRKKKKGDLPPPPGSLPLPPLPGELPPPPGLADLPPPPSTVSSEPEAELPPPPSLPSEPLKNQSDDIEIHDDNTIHDVDIVDEIEVVDDSDDMSNYSDLWENRTDKSLQQMYGHIDRLGSDDVGSLLERYADRFGHDLDREIIVMRKAEKESVRDTAPVVELISVQDEDSDDDDDDVGTSDLQDRLDSLENEMRPLKKKFDAAKSKKKQSAIAKFGNMLKPMVEERKILKGVISGDLSQSALDEYDSDMQDEADEHDDDGDVDNFAEFFNVVNNLLGDMPESFINDFLNSKNFKLFEKVGADPEGTSESNRKKFFKMVNQELGTIPDDKLSEFMATDDFQLFIEMSEIYG